MPATASAPASRSLRILSRDGDTWLLIEVTEKGAAEQYLVRPEPSDVGPAWRWDHAGKQTAYTVTLEGEQGPAGCTCPHGTHRGQARKECRHVAASRALIAKGKLRCQRAPKNS